VSVQVRKWPRKLLSDEERTIQATIARIGASPGAVIPTATMAPFVYVPLAAAASLQYYLDSMTSGGTLILDEGTYYLSAGLSINHANITLMGMGMYATQIKYTKDANTDIITITKGSTRILDLFIAGSDNYENGGGAIGTGRGIVIAPATTCPDVLIRNVQVANTGSWCIYSRELGEMTDLGTGVSPNKDYGYPLVATGGGGTVCLTLENVITAFPNSGGCLFLGYGCAAPRISALRTNSYSFGTYTRIDSAGGVAENIGAVHLFGTTDAVFDNKCVFQSPSAQGAHDVAHSDVDATMISFLNSTAHLDAPYFEVLSDRCADGPGRTHWLVTGVMTGPVTVDKPYVRSNVNDGAGHGYPLRIMHTPLDNTNSAVSSIWLDGQFNQYREFYDVITAVPPYEAGDPSVRDYDDFSFNGVSDGDKAHPIHVTNCLVSNLTTGKAREVTTTGASILSRRDATFTNRALHLGKFDDVDLAGLSGGLGPGGVNDLRASWNAAHNGSIRGGVIGYAGGGGGMAVYTIKNGTTTLQSNTANQFTNVAVGNAVSGVGIPANTYVVTHTDNSHVVLNNAATDSLTSTLQFTSNGAPHREGLWMSSARDNDFRQLPFIRVHASAPSGLRAGDLWMKLSGSPVSSLYPTATFYWYDGAQWQQAPSGLVAGDMNYWTAAGLSAQLAIGAASQVLKVSGGAPAWSDPDFLDSLFRVSDSGDPTKKLALEVSGITTGTTRTATAPNVPGLLGLIGNGANPPATGAIGKVDLTGQTGDIASTKLTDTTPAGQYLIHCVLEDTAADVTAGVATVTFSWTDDAGATTQTVTQTLAAAGRSALSFPLYLASGNITYAVTHTGIFGASQYALRVRAAFLG